MTIPKRSVFIFGHRTSISVEKDFWDELKNIASDKNIPINKLIEKIDNNRTGNLSSAIRLYILRELKSKIDY
ncbi:MAG: ribbon-helix-helix domain-containing protein [Alphaproteobacteria bacterium]|nr:ribbon-helix-helix domain-containing protein [Alphaproteobacteria bacterium]